MLRKIALAIALAAVCSVAYGQAKIEGPDKIAAFKFVDLKVSGEWESALWEIEPEANVDSRESDGGKTLTFVAPPGTYTARAYLISFTAKKAAKAKKTVVIEGAVTPDPLDPPEPPPVPGGKKQVAFYLESADLLKLPKAQRYVNSLAFRKALEAKGHAFIRTFDDDTDVPPEFAPWSNAAAGKPLPLMLLAPVGGGDIQAIALPADEAAALKAIDGGTGRAR